MDSRMGMIHVFQKMISAKVKLMFDEGNVDPAIKDSSVVSSGWIQNIHEKTSSFMQVDILRGVRIYHR